MKDDLFYLEKMLDKKDTLMILVNEEPNSTILSTLKQIWSNEGIYIKVISLARLQFNILKHTLVPPHRVMSKEEKQATCIKYNIKNDSQLPQISRFDPVAQIIGLRPGEICEIIRPIKTAITSKYYRVCLNEYKQNNKNEKEFFNHLYFFNWFLFIISIFLGYKAYKLYKSGPPIWDSMSEMFGTLTFGFLGKKNTFDTQPSK
jgi:DNA-directed RNA polymerase subunit H (RpoH/RPB5)